MVNIRVQVSLQDSDFISFLYIPRCGIVGSFGSSVFNFLRGLHTVFYGDCANLHSQQQSTRVPFCLHPPQHLLSLVIFIITILTGVRWYLIGVLICISLVISDVEHLFMYLLAIWVSFFWENVYSGPLLNIFSWIICFFLLSCWVPYVIWILTAYQIDGLQIFSLILLVVFLFCWWLPLLNRSILSVRFLVWCSSTCLFLYIKNELFEKEVKKTILFTITSKNKRL